MSSRPINPGMTIERYRVERRVGSGSMGDVYLGVDIGLDRKVALKILSDRHRDNRELRARFVREAKAVAAIAHPNVVQVFTTGSFDGRPYIAMEFLDGTDLGSVIERQGPFASTMAARAILDVARGLAAAARAGLIHRDVKPSNLVLLHDGSVKITDFGLAKPMDPGDQPALTALGVVVGTPDYIAPEQARGDKIDQRVDIYALGGTLYYLLTGMPPFRTGNPHQDKYLKVVARHLKDPPPDATARNPIADPQLSRLVRRMMAKDPAERPDYETLIQQLEAMVERLERESGPARPLGKQRVPPAASDQVSPTPVVGGAAPGPDSLTRPEPAIARGHDDEDAEATQVHMRSRSATPIPAPRRAPSRDSSVGMYPVIDTEPAPAPASSNIPGWVWLLTVLSVLVFVTGLALHFFGPVPESAAPDRARPDDEARAGSPNAVPGTSAANPASGTQTPEGMLAVQRDDGTTFYVDASPVTASAYAAVFPAHQIGGAPDQPIFGVSYAYASSYADAVGKRLPTPDEWQRASSHPGFQRADHAWEWIANPDEASDGTVKERPVVSSSGQDKRPAKGARDVTFRLVMPR